MIPCPKTLLVTAGMLALIKRTDTIQTYKCLGHDIEINAALTSTHPPFDNYYNISRAIFPVTDVSSLYVRIRVKFVSDRGDETQLYTWAMSCLYVATEYISLFAMNWYSLGAILPNRRQTELHITLPELCSNLTDDNNGSDSKMFYFLSTLEDVSMKPNALDPQLNTVECVVKGHSDFTKKIFAGVKYYTMMNICWCTWVISLMTAFVSSLLIITWLNFKDPDDAKDIKYQKKSATFLFSVLSCLELIIACVAMSDNSPNTYPLVFFVSIIIISVVFVIIYVQKEHINKYNFKKEFCRIVKAVAVFDSLFMTSHHLIWILLGVITEPFWAIPVLVVACSFCFSVYVLAFYNCKAFDKCDFHAIGLSVGIIITLLLFFFTTGVVSQSFLSNSPVAGLIQSALVIITSLWMNYVKNNLSEQAVRDSRDGPVPAGPTQMGDLLLEKTQDEAASVEETKLNTTSLRT